MAGSFADGGGRGWRGLGASRSSRPDRSTKLTDATTGRYLKTHKLRGGIAHWVMMQYRPKFHLNSWVDAHARCEISPAEQALPPTMKMTPT